LILLLALVLRIAPHEPVAGVQPLSERYRPVAAAIGLTHDIPEKATLATYFNAALYACHYRALSLVSPTTSSIDFCARFLSDPVAFSSLARYASVAAGVVAVLLLWLLITRLFDPVTGLAAAFVLAVHPSAVASAVGSDSTALSLVFLLAALLIAFDLTRRRPRNIDFVALGLTLGFAVDAFPIAFIFVPLIAVFIYRREHLAWPGAGSIALGLACFGVAALTVGLPAISASALHLVLVALVSAFALIAAFYAVSALRRNLAAPTYSSIVLCLAIVAGTHVVDDIEFRDVHRQADAPATASRWLTENLPEGSLIFVHPDMISHLQIPRSAQSWRRQLASGTPTCYSRVYLLAAAHAASTMPGPSWDVRLSPHPVCAALEAVASARSSTWIVFVLGPPDGSGRESMYRESNAGSSMNDLAVYMARGPYTKVGLRTATGSPRRRMTSIAVYSLNSFESE
jgi:hypothetical protein